MPTVYAGVDASAPTRDRLCRSPWPPAEAGAILLYVALELLQDYLFGWAGDEPEPMKPARDETLSTCPTGNA